MSAKQQQYQLQHGVETHHGSENHEGGLANPPKDQPAIINEQPLGSASIQPRKTRQEAHPDLENRSLEDLALEQMGYIDVALITEPDNYSNINPIIAAPLPVVSDLFWQ